MSNEKRFQNEHGVFVLERHEGRVEFVCDRCLAPKVARVQVSWEDAASGKSKVICNGCYGNLRS